MTICKLSMAFSDLRVEVAALESAWACERKRPVLREAFGELRERLEAVLPLLDPIEIDDQASARAHEAHRSTVAFGLLMRQAIRLDFAPRFALAATGSAVAALLDALNPYVTRKDDAIRRVLLEDETIDRAVRRMPRAN